MIPEIWLVIGFLGQFLFFLRFLIQWIVSERRGRSAIPLPVWYFSLAGGAILLTYAIHRADPVFIMGQAGGLLVYSRNLILIRRENRKKSSTNPVV
ncbi:MAG: lipid-A-disaccharide synthase N-terminal domain-containing protein [Acidobacteriota bacterium]